MYYLSSEMISETAANAQQQVEKANQLVTYFKDMIPDLINFGMQIVIAIIIWFIGTKVIRLIRKMMQRAMTRSDMAEGAKQFLDSFLKFALYFLLIVIIGTRFGVTTASVVALLGSAGLAVGLALQGSLSNFAGGVLILLLKPFLVGDYIITESGKEGLVDEIQIFYTKLRTGDNQMIVIPNGKLSGGEVTNVSRMDKRRLDLSIQVGYETNLEKVKALIETLLLQEPLRISEDEIDVFVERLGENGIFVGARLWVKTTDYWEVKCRLTQKLKETMDQNQIVIPSKKLDITIQKEQIK